MRRRFADRDARGMVTAELAVAMLAAFAVLVMLCWGIFLLVLQLRCVDTASSLARQEARGDAAAASIIRAAAPPHASITVQRRSELIRVTVRVRAMPLGSWLPTVPLTAEAVVVPEPSGRPS